MGTFLDAIVLTVECTEIHQIWVHQKTIVGAKFVLDVHCVASFRNQRALKGQILHF